MEPSLRFIWRLLYVKVNTKVYLGDTKLGLAADLLAILKIILHNFWPSFLHQYILLFYFNSTGKELSKQFPGEKENTKVVIKIIIFCFIIKYFENEDGCWRNFNEAMIVHTWIFYIFCWFSWVEPHKPQKILSLHQISAECNLLLQAWPTTGRCWGNKAKSQKATRSSTLVLHHENYVWILVLQTGLSVFWLVDTKRNYDQFLSTIYPITYKGPDQNCAIPKRGTNALHEYVVYILDLL